MVNCIVNSTNWPSDGNWCFFALTDRWRLQFIKSNFAGQLPKPYSRRPRATQIFPSHMNDANREEVSRYVGYFVLIV